MQMRNVFCCAISVVALACYSAAAARADVIRVATVVAENPTDFANNVALVPTFAGLLKKAPAIKATFSGTDEAKLTIVTTSVWAQESDIKSVTDTPEWKAAAGKLKYKTYTAEIFQVVQ
jgi:hypothetical protein